MDNTSSPASEFCQVVTASTGPVSIAMEEDRTTGKGSSLLFCTDELLVRVESIEEREWLVQCRHSRAKGQGAVDKLLGAGD